MDINYLKLILETVKTVSGDAQTVAVWWIVVDKLAPVIAWLFAGSGAVYLIRKMIIVSERTSIAESCEEDMKCIGRMLNTFSGTYLTKQEREATIDEVRKLAPKNE